jgi:IS30 family transposase
MQKRAGTKKPHLSYEERVKIEGFLGIDYSYQEIASALKRSKAAIGDEVKRSGGRQKYRAEKAQKRADLKQKQKKRECVKVALSRFLTKFVEQKLRLGWSPERIACRLRFLKTTAAQSEYASGKSIRKYIKGRHGLESFLYSRRHKKKPGVKKGVWIAEAGRHFVTAMPAWSGSGVFQIDFIVSSASSSVLLVIVDMATKLTLMRILPRRINTEVCAAIAEMVAPYKPKYLIPDNDIAFADWKALEEAVGAEVYFARPFCSTDKPLVENTNRWIRFHAGVPKKTDFADVDPEKIALTQEWFFHTPRECLYGRTPWEAYVLEKEGRVILEETYPRHPVLSPLQGLPFAFGGRDTSIESRMIVSSFNKMSISPCTTSSEP